MKIMHVQKDGKLILDLNKKPILAIIPYNFS